jgi:predicted  nucleic acid-binding Zn-ribbon protein
VNIAADTEKPVAEVQTQAQTMSVVDLRATALEYVQAISVKREDLQKLLAQVKEIPVAEALSEKAKTLKAEVQKIESSIKDLTDRFQVYYNQLKEKGGDLSDLTI